ncbi:hypothetical protein TRIATDRAFT_36276 [Trichoderma atroviride IMI 206040]|uniref:C2H2-type domain-containing protein n=2 Tax=Hypocrea atroviridis TaxID=63577 RepID=G9NYY8_HYPAI|nr:uncharacterized protein TRIATDRAFT_36276 [Trichoderma atroviride IMI 206040]EHK44540.1 hypothetical protein TRIATDRAFT_36276 [Trichoderma atroviride IMI 206040]
MEPSSKKRKLAPKVNTSAAPNPQPAAQYSHETPQQQPYPVHDVPVAERQDFEAFARHLQDAAMLIQRQTERPPHSDVSVLLLNWEEDRTVDEDVVAMEQVMQKQYGFNTQRWQIPTVPNPSIKLGVQMASFLENARPNHLLIIYYAGYGYAGPDGQLYWACNAREDAAKLKWDGVKCLFEDAQSDILLLLDTCAKPDPTAAGSHGVKQAIAACSPEHKLRDDPGQRSFTSYLVESLHKLSSAQQPFSSQRLWEEICQQQQQQHANSPATAPSTPPVLPIFFTLTPAKGHGLMLASMVGRAPAPPLNGVDVPDGQSGRAREDNLIDADSVADLRFDEARILVCTTFVGDASPDMSYFHQWLQNKPTLGAAIAVEGMFLGPPTMLLISMPHSIWNVVQHDKVCCFLGYISSHNMIHLYEKLVGPGGIRPSAKEVEDGRILLEARELAAGTPSRTRREPDPYLHAAARDGLEYRSQSSPSGAPYTPATPRNVAPIKPKDEVEDSAEMQEAAEQLKALSHVRPRGDDGPPPPPPSSSHPPIPIPAAPTTLPALPPLPPISALPPSPVLPAVRQHRTTLPDGIPESRQCEPSSSRDIVESGAADGLSADSAAHLRIKAPRRSLPKQETRCNHCSHAPFKDTSSLRKHIAAAHTRPFPCAFSFAGCASTFGSKNEWKRHIASQHLCLTYYCCSACPQSAVEGKGNEFNRKDLFTQHLRRMHAPFQIKRTIAKGDSKLMAEWDAHVKEMQQSCLVTRRHPPQKSACPRKECNAVFEGPTSWDEWTEHVGRHMEKGEAQRLGIDKLLAEWALDEGIIELRSDGEYRLCATNGVFPSSSNGGMNNGIALHAQPALEHKESSLSLAEHASSAEETPAMEAKPAEDTIMAEG